MNQIIWLIKALFLTALFILWNVFGFWGPAVAIILWIIYMVKR